MAMRLLPGARPVDASRELGAQLLALSNLLGRGMSSEQTLGGFLQWALEAERMLCSHFDADDVTEQIFTKRYWSLQSPSPAGRDMIPVLVEAGVSEQRRRLQRELARLNDGHNRWQRGRLVLPDTSALIHGPKLWEWDPAESLELRDKPVRLILPILVIDELDDLKESTKGHTRFRARETLKWIAEQLGGHQRVLIREAGILHTPDGASRDRGTLHLDVLLDEEGHRRLPIADDEIVDRASFIASISGSEVMLVTNDVGQAHRARLRGLLVSMVSDPIYDVDVQEASRAEKVASRERQRQAQQVPRKQTSTPSTTS